MLVRLVVGAYPLGVKPLRNRRTVYFANHTSHLDTLVLLAALPRASRLRARPVAAMDYWGKPGIRRWIANNILNVILIDRHRTTDTNPLEPLIESLNEGCCLIIFPEGTRGEGTLPNEFKAGLYHLSQACPDADFVPVYLENLNRIFPKKSLLLIPLINRVNFGAPLPKREGEQKESFLRRAREAVISLAPDRSS